MKKTKVCEKENFSIMNYSHPKWESFLSKLDIELRKKECEHTHNLACKVILEYFDDVSVKKTLTFLKSKGGFCDCEVMLNVKRKQNIHTKSFNRKNQTKMKTRTEIKNELSAFYTKALEGYPEKFVKETLSFFEDKIKYYVNGGWDDCDLEDFLNDMRVKVVEYHIAEWCEEEGKDREEAYEEYDDEWTYGEFPIYLDSIIELD